MPINSRVSESSPVPSILWRPPPPIEAAKSRSSGNEAGDDFLAHLAPFADGAAEAIGSMGFVAAFDFVFAQKDDDCLLGIHRQSSHSMKPVHVNI